MLPLSIKTMGSAAFGGCVALSFINFNQLKELESMGGSAFRYCSALVEVALSELPKLKEIGSDAFRECSDLTNFVFPPNITIIKQHTLQYIMFKLTVAYVKLPASLQTIEKGAIPTPSPNFCLEAGESISKAGIIAVLSMRNKNGVLKFFDVAGNVKGKCSLSPEITTDGAGIYHL